MNLNTLKPALGATKNNYRRGRGQGSGGGGTATRGHKGAQSRSGYSSKRSFEGGQTPLQRRLPKFGFKNINRIEYKVVNLDTLQHLAETKNITEITKEVLLNAGLASKNDLVKVLGRGELTAKVNVTLNKFSTVAQEAITKVGGSFTTL